MGQSPSAVKEIGSSFYLFSHVFNSFLEEHAVYHGFHSHTMCDLLTLMTKCIHATNGFRRFQPFPEITPICFAVHCGYLPPVICKQHSAFFPEIYFHQRFHLNGIRQYLVFCSWRLSFNKMLSMFINVLTWSRHHFLLINPMLLTHFYIQSLSDGYLSGFPFWAVTNSAVMNVVYISLCGLKLREWEWHVTSSGKVRADQDLVQHILLSLYLIIHHLPLYGMISEKIMILFSYSAAISLVSKCCLAWSRCSVSICWIFPCFISQRLSEHLLCIAICSSYED
jgi:hypothetical protein